MNAATRSYPTQPMMFPMFPQPMPSPVMGVNGNGDYAKQTPVVNGTAASNGAAGGSCCGGSSNKQVVSQPSTAHTSPGTDGSATQEKKSSCCSSTPVNSGNATSRPGTTNGISAPVATNGMMMPGYPAPMGMAPNGMYPFYPQSTVFTYPPQYGSFMQPLQPEQWRQFIASMSFAQPAGQQGHTAGFEMPTPMAFPDPGSTTMGASTSHECGCGDNCQCVGCAAHPYNDATQDYVRSAWNSMSEDSRVHAAASTNGQHRSLNGHADFTHAGMGGESEVALMKEAINGHAPTPSGGGESSEIALMKDAINGVPPTASTVAAAGGDGNVSPTAPQTPSEAASGMSDEQILSANDFFFVSYPFGDSCAGDTASCPCGDECQCIGCVIHGNANNGAEAVAL